MSKNKKDLLSSSSNSNDEENKDETDNIQNINFNIQFFPDKNKNGNSSHEESEHSSNNEEDDDDDFDDDEDEDEDDSPVEKENQSEINCLNNQESKDINEINKPLGMSLLNTSSTNSSMGGEIIATKDYLFPLFDYYQNKPQWYIKDKNTNIYIEVTLTTLDLFDKLCSLLPKYKFENLIVNLHPIQYSGISEISTFKLFMNLCEYFSHQLDNVIKGNLQQIIQQQNMIYNQNQNQNQIQNNNSNMINQFFGNGNFHPNNCLSGFGC
jgi:hypothetical protein